MFLRSKRFLSFVLIIGLVVMGIYCNLSTVYASHPSVKMRMDFIADMIRARYDSASAEQFITYMTNHIDDGMIVMLWDANNTDNFMITIFDLNTTAKWWFTPVDDSYWLNALRPGTSTGAVYRVDGYFNSYSDGSAASLTFHCQSGFVTQARRDDSRLTTTPNFNSNKVWLPTGAQFGSSNDYFCFNNREIWLGANSSIVAYSRNLFGALVALYQNVVFSRNNRLYFTPSDQNVIFDVFIGSADAEMLLTFEGSVMNEEGQFEYTNIYITVTEDDLVRFPDIISYSGVSNIAGTGLRAFDITSASSYSKLTASRVNPNVYYEQGYFANNECIISDTITTPVDPYDELGQALSDLNARLTELENASVPDYDLQHYVEFPDSSINGASYPDLTSDLYRFSVDLAGIARLHNSSNSTIESLDVSPRSVLVVRSNEYGLSALTGKLLTSSDIASIWSEVDVVIVLSNSDYDAIVEDPVFSPVYISVWNDSGLTYNSSWFLADWENMIGFPTSYTYYYGVGFFTQHYLMCVNNYILSDGFSMIADGLTKLGDLNKDGFQTVASAIGTVYSAVQVTNSHWVNFLRDFGSFKDSLLGKLDLIIDKLDTLIDNTDERMHDFWIRPVYDFISSFTPSLTGFGNWINEIETDVESLPQIPVVTVPALPTLPPLIEGD